MNHSRWNLLPLVPEGQSGSGVSVTPLMRQLFYNRGLSSPEEIDSFLVAGADLSADPYLLPGMHQAVSRLYRAMLSNETIAVYGDFDTDGITATALLVQGLSLLGCCAVPYIPHRMTEGYGLNTPALEKLRAQGVTLVITVDCGITAVAEVKNANHAGLDIIITDHHTPPEGELPPACALINPKLPDSEYPFTELAGVGVALKLLQAFFRNLGKERLLEGLTDLTALGTIADMVPLLGENRYLVKRGLDMLSNSPRLGIREMIASSNLKGPTLNSQNISWTIAPRLNAAGRLEHAMGSYKLLMTESVDEARHLAGWLEKKNAERQRLTAASLEKAREQVREQAESPVIIAADESFQAGIVGLVAGRLMEEFYRPAIVLRTTERHAGGSCRSIAEFDIIAALKRCGHLLTHYGGHARAAGLGLSVTNLPSFRDEITALAAEELKGVDLRPRIDIEAEVCFQELAGDTWTDIQKLEPFGQGNPAPVFLSRCVEVIDCRTMGSGADHLRLKLRQGESAWDAVGFGLGCYMPEMSRRIDIVYCLELDRWNGRESLRLNLSDFAPSA